MGMPVSGKKSKKTNAKANAKTRVATSARPTAKATGNAIGDLSSKRVAVLGAGKIGGILLRAFLQKNLVLPKNARATVKHPERAAELSKALGVSVTTDNRAAARGADIILIAVKPLIVAEVAQAIRGDVGPNTLVISVAASVPTSHLEQKLPSGVPVIRAMPNTPCAIGMGMTGLAKGSHATAAHLEIARTLFESAGRVAVVDEKLMDAVTGLSASGTAFIYVILESLAEAGVKTGLSREIATLLAAQTMAGAAEMVLQTGDHPALLKDGVTTPAGCTIDGLLELEDGKVRVTLIKAVVKATERARELMFDK
jgi:pyrroline-5-carboxylate reductase